MNDDDVSFGCHVALCNVAPATTPILLIPLRLVMLAVVVEVGDGCEWRPLLMGMVVIVK